MCWLRTRHAPNDVAAAWWWCSSHGEDVLESLTRPARLPKQHVREQTSLQTQLSEPLGSWCRWQDGKTCRLSIKSLRCLHFSSPGIHTTTYALIVQCWLETWGWWQVTNGTCPCTSCLQSWICSVFLERAWRADVLSLQQAAWPYSDSINSSVCLSGPANIYLCKAEMLAQEKARDAYTNHLYPAEQGGTLRAAFHPSLQNQPQISYISGQCSEQWDCAKGLRVGEEDAPPTLIMSLKDRPCLSTEEQQNSGRGRRWYFWGQKEMPQ